MAAPARLGQGTAVEQSRAIAQVQAMVIVAQQCPRSIAAAVREMEEACAQIELAEQAFFRFPRGSETVQGPSVHLARELARCWGNIEYGVTELRRDDNAAQSEMLAFAWDLQVNTRSSAIFIVPHKRDTKSGVKTLTDMRDIYESNANNGARRVREAIFAVLPVWFRQRAENLCRQTIENGGGTPLATRVADAVKAFEKLRVSPARLAAKFGYKSIDDLTATDVAQLGVIYSSIKQGTVTVDDEFPAEPDRIAATDLAPPKSPSPAGTDAPPSAPSVAPPDAQPAGEGPILTATVEKIWERLAALGVEERNYVRVASQVAGRPMKHGTEADGRKVLDTLEGLDQVGLDGLLADLMMASDPRGGTDGE